MPCSPDPVCNRTDTNTYASVNRQGPASGAPYANMGWVGFVLLNIPSLPGSNNILRVTSADINLSQDIEMPDVVDGRIDRTIYKLGPKLVEGSMSMPVVADTPGSGGCLSGTPKAVAAQLLDNIWCWATARGQQGRLLYSDAILDIRYANHAAFRFDNAIVNTLSMSVAQGDQVTFDISIIGRGRKPTSLGGSPFPDPTGGDPRIRDYLSPARVLTWNDVTITGIRGCGSPLELFYSNQVRDFSMEINNNADRYYTLNGSLYPMDINVGKREITGSLTLLGYQEQLRVLAESNQDRFTEKNEIRVALYIGEDTFQGATFSNRDWTGSASNPPQTAIFAKVLTSVVFQIEEVSLSNEVLETSINWHALANDLYGYQSITPASCAFPAWS